MTDTTSSLAQLRELYDEVELAILFDWLAIPRPAGLEGIDVEAESGGPERDSGPIRLIRDVEGRISEWTLSNAVARLVLSEIQDRLPQWAAAYADGRVDLARAYTPRRRARIELLPRFQFMINWADSGPGFSWPESYHAAYLPGFHRYVVTASQDSPDVHGYTDEAIGHFGAEEAFEAGVHRTVVDCWRWQAENTSQNRWAYLFDAGAVDDETAATWADEVWDAESGEPLRVRR